MASILETFASVIHTDDEHCEVCKIIAEETSSI